MKLTHTITMASALLLAAGCAHEEHSVRTGETDYSSGRMTEYNNPGTAPAIGGSYSADGSYSSGGGGTYSSRPAGNYSGTVGADGTYTPDPNSVASTPTPPPGAYSGIAGTQSDNAVVAQIRESLRQDPDMALIAPSIQISAHNGSVLLSGHVQSQEQKRQIMTKVLSIGGVLAVNNQLNVMAGGANVNGENPHSPQLYPTGNNSDSQRLYKDADGRDTSTNNTLNATPQPLNPTSRPNSSSQIYHESDPGNVQTPNGNLSTNNLSPTVRSDGQSEMYQGSRQENLSNMNSASNSVNGANNSMTPTSRTNGSSQIYQNNSGENLPNGDTNNVQNSGQTRPNNSPSQQNNIQNP
jgi:hypothetical protein